MSAGQERKHQQHRPEQSGAADQSVPVPGRDGAAAPRHPGASGAGETSFGDAEGPAAPARATAEEGEPQAAGTERAGTEGAGTEGAGTEAAGAEAPAAEAAEQAPAEDPLAAAQRQAQEYLGLAQRAQADFDNFRKRTAREAALAADRGVQKTVKELLPALDHLELALQAAEKEGQAPELVKGIRLIQDEFANALGRVGVEIFSPEGEAFDPAQHEAMASQPAEGAEAGTVLTVYQQGYRLNGAVVRPARVVVAG